MIRRRVLLAFPRAALLGTLAVMPLAAVFVIGAAQAQDYPSRPVKIIVPTPPGGPVDVIARITANYLQTSLHQGFVVENRPGAGNTIGSKDAAEATPDGYTLLYSSASGLVIAPLLHPNAGYNPLTSYDPIALVGQSSNILVVNPSVPAKTVQELVAYAKANPGKVNFSSGGIGVLPHLIGEMFKARAGVNIVHVPYKGGGPSITDLVAGNVQMTFEGTSVLLPLIQAGKLRALAVTTPKRIPHQVGGVHSAFGQLGRVTRTMAAAMHEACQDAIAQLEDACGRAAAVHAGGGILRRARVPRESRGRRSDFVGNARARLVTGRRDRRPRRVDPPAAGSSS